jgi:hypothetical protein
MVKETGATKETRQTLTSADASESVENERTAPKTAQQSGKPQDRQRAAGGEKERVSGAAGTPSKTPAAADLRDVDESAFSTERFTEAGDLVTSAEPDVVLDVKNLSVGLIEFVLQDLRAHVALDAEVASLVRLKVGADASLGEVRLTIKDVHAAVTLQVKLGKVYAILARALTTIDRNPQMLESLLKPVGEAVGEVGRGAGEMLPPVGKGLGQVLPSIGEGVGQMLPPMGQGLGTAAGEVGKGVGQTLPTVGSGLGVSSHLEDTKRPSARTLKARARDVVPRLRAAIGSPLTALRGSR